MWSVVRGAGTYHTPHTEQDSDSVIFCYREPTGTQRTNRLTPKNWLSTCYILHVVLVLGCETVCSLSPSRFTVTKDH